MLKLTLLRHAKSSWSYPGLEDFLRPLNERGYRQAKGLSERFPNDTDVIWCSTAVRAYSTISHLIQMDPLLRERVSLRNEIYHASAEILLELLREADVKHLTLVGHNPELEVLAQYLTGSFIELKTAHMLELTLDCPGWGSIVPACAEVVSLWRPQTNNKPE